MPFGFLFILKTEIVWLFNHLFKSVAGEGYSRNVSCAFRLNIYVFIQSLYICIHAEDSYMKLKRSYCYD